MQVCCDSLYVMRGLGTERLQRGDKGAPHLGRIHVINFHYLPNSFSQELLAEVCVLARQDSHYRKPRALLENPVDGFDLVAVGQCE